MAKTSNMYRKVRTLLAKAENGTPGALQEAEQIVAEHGLDRARLDFPKAKRTNKTATLLEMIKRSQGASMNELIAATGWQPHSCRGALSAAKKKHGLAVELKGGRYYAR